MKISSMILPLAAALALLAASHPAQAQAARIGWQASGQLLDLGVYDRDNHQRLPVYRYEGRYYVAGIPGHRYLLSLRNRSDEAVLAVPSVDGVNANTGETADWSQDGYVLGAYQNYDLKGWRKSLSQVAGFVFAAAESGYAARTGRPDNVGVIGLAVFRRRPQAVAIAPAATDSDRVASPAPITIEPASPPPAPAAPIAEMAQSAPAPSMLRRADAATSTAKASSPLGTGFGRRERDQVETVDFERASSEPDEVITLYYDTYAHLAERGVLPAHPLPPRQPEAFPGRFVPDPPGTLAR